MHDEPLWLQARPSSFLWLKCKPFWKLTGYWLTCKYPEENMKKLIIKRLCLLTLQLGSCPFLFRALYIHSSHCISLWLLSGQWHRRQSHTEPLLASSMNEWLIPTEPPLHAFNSSVSSTKQVTTSEGPWSTQRRLDPSVKPLCGRMLAFLSLATTSFFTLALDVDYEVSPQAAQGSPPAAAV